MLNTIQRIYDYLAASDAYGFYTAVSTRVWSPVVAADFLNTQPAVVFHVASERSHKTNATHTAQVTFKCYGGGATHSSASTVYRLLHDKLHGKGSYANKILEASQVAASQQLVDPEKGWPYVIVTYQIIFNQ